MYSTNPVSTPLNLPALRVEASTVSSAEPPSRTAESKLALRVFCFRVRSKAHCLKQLRLVSELLYIGFESETHFIFSSNHIFRMPTLSSKSGTEPVAYSEFNGERAHNCKAFTGAILKISGPFRTVDIIYIKQVTEVESGSPIISLVRDRRIGQKIIL